MVLDKKTIGTVSILLLVALVAAWWFFVYRKKKSGDGEKKAPETPKVTIYGSLGCPYTVKQIEKYPNHVFVDCNSEKCPDFVTAYPTTKHEDGRIEVGFS